MTREAIIQLIHREVKPALGCTEPIAVALAVAKAVEIISENCPSCSPDWRLTADFTLEVAVSGNILKNGMGVGIPGTGMVGLPVAAALGAVCGDSSLGKPMSKRRFIFFFFASLNLMPNPPPYLISSKMKSVKLCITLPAAKKSAPPKRQ